MFGEDDDHITEYDLLEYCTIQEANITMDSCNVRDLAILYINIVCLPSNMNELIDAFLV